MPPGPDHAPRPRPRPLPVGLTLFAILAGSVLLLTGTIVLQVIGGAAILAALAAPILRLAPSVESKADQAVPSRGVRTGAGEEPGRSRRP